jgi:SAM-dependent methyltransferase
MPGYDPAFYQQLAAIEDRHFWFRSRNRLIFEIAKGLSASFSPGFLALEVGCGTGSVLATLRAACAEGTVIGMELWFDGLRFAQARSAGPLVQADVRNLPFARAFDLVGLFDVLEHIPEERESLSALSLLLSPGGYLMLTVPAHQSLWSYFDEASHHCRRYGVEELRIKLSKAGFEVVFLSQFMTLLFPLMWLTRKLPGSGGPAKHRAEKALRPMPVLNELVDWLLRPEAGWLARNRTLPIGTSIIAIARKT